MEYLLGAAKPMTVEEREARAERVALEECYLRLVRLSYEAPRADAPVVDRCVAAARELVTGAREIDRVVAAATKELRDRLSDCVTLLEQAADRIDLDRDAIDVPSIAGVKLRECARRAREAVDRTAPP